MHQGEKRHAADQIRARGRQGRVRNRVPQDLHQRHLSGRPRGAAHASARLQGDLGRDPVLPVERPGSGPGGQSGVRSDRRLPLGLQGRADPLMQDHTTEATRGRPSRGALGRPRPATVQRRARKDRGLSFRGARRHRSPDLRRRANDPVAQSRLLLSQRFRRIHFRRARQLSTDAGRPAVLAQSSA